MAKKKQLYVCSSCRNRFEISKAGQQALQQKDRKAQCQRCGSYDTYPAGIAINPRPKGSLDDRPTDKQIEYIKSLGGNPANVKTKRQASEVINRLKGVR